MKSLELKVLKYINKKDTISETQLIKRFSKLSNVTLNYILFNLRSQNYIYERNSIIEITDKGQIIAISDYIDKMKRLKERIIGFFFGVLSSIIVALVKILLL